VASTEPGSSVYGNTIVPEGDGDVPVSVVTENAPPFPPDPPPRPPAPPPVLLSVPAASEAAATAAAVPMTPLEMPPSACLTAAEGECGVAAAATCTGTAGTICCSAGGYCGSGEAYCGEGTQHEYSNSKNLCGAAAVGQQAAGLQGVGGTATPSTTTDSSASAAIDPASYPEDVRCIDATFRLVNPDICSDPAAVSTAPIGQNAGDKVGMPGDGGANSIVPEAADGVPVDVVTSAPQDTLKGPEPVTNELAPNPGGCKATNPTLTAAAQADWGLWCDNTCLTRSNCLTPEMTGAAQCVCV